MKRGQGIACALSNKKIGYAVPICLMDFKKPYCGCEGEFEIQSCPYGRLEGTGVCRNSAMIKCCVEKCFTSLDLVIIIDESGSIGPDNYIKEKNFVKEVIQNLDIGINKTRVSIIRFNNIPDLSIKLNEGTSKNNIIELLDKMKYKQGKF